MTANKLNLWQEQSLTFKTSEFFCGQGILQLALVNLWKIYTATFRLLNWSSKLQPSLKKNDN